MAEQPVAAPTPAAGPGPSGHRTVSPIESTFATVRLRTKVTKGAGSRAAGLAMVVKLVESAQARWRTVNGAHLVPLVHAGTRFEYGLLVERDRAMVS